MNDVDKHEHRQRLALEAWKAGVHDHYKGGRYTALFLAQSVSLSDYDRADRPMVLLEVRHHDTREVVAVFKEDGPRPLIYPRG